MKVFPDPANLDEIRASAALAVVDGVTAPRFPADREQAKRELGAKAGHP